MKTRIVLGLVVAAAGWAFAEGAGDGCVRVAADRVNLRARPLADAEVVAQAGEGDLLTVRRYEGDWVEVVAPTGAAVWVKASFLKDGAVVSDRLNVRSGPSLSYRDVGSLRKGERVTVLETKGEWLRIAPPAALSLWVSRSLVKSPDAAAGSAVAPAATPPPVSPISAGPAALPEAAAPAAPAPLTRSYPDGITEDLLAPVLGQGAVIERRGIVDRVPLAFLRGVEFRLVDPAGGKATVCYLRGGEGEMAGRMGQSFAARGRGYWLRGERVPLIYVTPE